MEYLLFAKESGRFDWNFFRLWGGADLLHVGIQPGALLRNRLSQLLNIFRSPVIVKSFSGEV